MYFKASVHCTQFSIRVWLACGCWGVFLMASVVSDSLICFFCLSLSSFKHTIVLLKWNGAKQFFLKVWFFQPGTCMLNTGRCLLSLLLEFGFLTFAMAFLFFFPCTKTLIILNYFLANYHSCLSVIWNIMWYRQYCDCVSFLFAIVCILVPLIIAV